MKNLFKLLLAVIIVFSLVGCSSGTNKPKVVIYSTAEDFRNEHYQKRLNEKFPEYDVTVQYVSTGNTAAKLKSAGKDIEADIINDLEESYCMQLEDNFYTLEDYDYSDYLPEFHIKSKKYVTTIRFSGAIILNEDVLNSKGLPTPTSYEDLLDPQYKGLISMPSPKASSTGYMFLKNLENVMGEEGALAYFDKLAPNILQFTTSGSGPVNALIQGEVGIGLGMTFQAVSEINKGAKLSITYFEEGSPWATSGIGIVEGKQDKEGVKEVFEFFANTLIREDKELFLPEPIFNVQENNIENYPKDIPYGDMSNNTNEVRESLLSKWKY